MKLLGPARKIGAPNTWINTRVALGLVLVVAFFVVSGWIAASNIDVMRDDAAKIQHSHDVIVSLDDLLSSVKDAETGQRGYMLTGKDEYLAPYDEAIAAVGPEFDRTAELTRQEPIQQARLAPLRQHIDAKLAELRQTIDLRRSKGFDAALAVVATDRGKAEMGAIRGELGLMQQEETRLRQLLVDEMAAAYRTTWISGILSALLGVGLTLLIGFLIRLAGVGRERQQWLQNGQARLASVMLGDPAIEHLGEGVLGFLTEFLGAHGGVIFAGDGVNYHRIASHGVPSDARIVQHFSLKEGLLGRVAADRKPSVLDDVPEGYLTIGSALGEATPATSSSPRPLPTRWSRA